MKTRQAMAACVVLAMGAHGALLLRPSAQASPVTASSGSAMSVRFQVAAQALAQHLEAADEPATSPESVASGAPAPLPAPQASLAEREAPPTFEGGVPAIAFPDAALPEGGTHVRAYLVLDPQGAAQSVATAAPPQLPAAFQKVTEAALRQARLQPASAAAYCLLVSFDADAQQARLAWLPGAAKDAGRCLTGALPAPREIMAAEAAP